jgi:hypothetical protein
MKNVKQENFMFASAFVSEQTLTTEQKNLLKEINVLRLSDKTEEAEALKAKLDELTTDAQKAQMATRSLTSLADEVKIQYGVGAMLLDLVSQVTKKPTAPLAAAVYNKNMIELFKASRLEELDYKNPIVADALKTVKAPLMDDAIWANVKLTVTASFPDKEGPVVVNSSVSALFPNVIASLVQAVMENA